MQTDVIEAPPIIDLEEYIGRGLQAAADIDRGKWTIGDDAVDINAKYGRYNGHVLADYAKGINLPVDRVAEYHGVCKFFPKSARAEYLESNPAITYTHLRDAKRLKDYGKAMAFLDQCSAEAWSVEKARIELQRTLGKPVPPIRKTFDVQTVRQAGNGLVLLCVREADLVRQMITDHNEAALTLVVSYEPPASADGSGR